MLPAKKLAKMLRDKSISATCQMSDPKATIYLDKEPHEDGHAFISRLRLALQDIDSTVQIVTARISEERWVASQGRTAPRVDHIYVERPAPAPSLK